MSSPQTHRKERLKQLRQLQADYLPVRTIEGDRDVAVIVRQCRRFAQAISGPDADPSEIVRAFQTSFNLALKLRAEQASDTAAADAATRRMQEGPPHEGMSDPEWVLNARRMAMGDIFSIFGGSETIGFRECVLVGTSTQFCCSGVLIHPKAVLTAAHCTGGFGCAASRIGIGNDQSSLDRPPIDVVDVRIAPNFDPVTFHNDIAVLVLEKEIDGIIPAEFASTAEIDAATSITAVGFGATNATGTSGFGTKRQAAIAVRSRACNGAGHAVTFGCQPNSELVAISLNITDTCTGDSGGPIYVRAPGGALVLAGITSRPVRNANVATICGSGGIYPRIDAHRGFIDSVLQTL